MKISKLLPIINMKTKYFASVLTLLVCVSAGQSVAQTVLVNENWESYASGATPVSPWVNWTGSPSGTLGSVTVTDAIHSTFSSGTNSVLLSGVSSSAGGVALSQTFAVTTSALLIEFDFYLPSTGNGVLPSFNLSGLDSNSVSKTGITLNFTNGFLAAGNYIANQGNAWNLGTTITPTQLNKWWHVAITTSDVSSLGDTFSITLTPYGGTSVTVDGLFFKNELSSFNKIEFSWNSGNGLGSMYIDNIVVATVPEPSALLLLSGGIAFFAFAHRARKEPRF